MDKYERRRQRLIELRDTKCGGNAAELARRIERDASYVTRMLYPEGKRGKKRIADEMIEVIEVAFGLPQGWLDHISEHSKPMAAVQRVVEDSPKTRHHSNPAIQEVIRLMETTDNNGRMMVLGAVKLTLLQYIPTSRKK